MKPEDLAQIHTIARAAAQQSAATIEAMRDMQTGILKGIEAFARGNFEERVLMLETRRPPQSRPRRLIRGPAEQSCRPPVARSPPKRSPSRRARTAFHCCMPAQDGAGLRAMRQGRQQPALCRVAKRAAETAQPAVRD